MKVILQEVTKEALALPSADQEVLAEKLVGNLVSRMPAAVKRRQLAEVMRRRQEILGGKLRGVSAEQVLREIQALVK